MPAGRIILKSISDSHKLSKLKTDGARLLYTWLITHLDINGCFSGDPQVVKGKVFTRLNKSIKTIEDYLKDMEENKLILRYEVDGDIFLIVPDFAEKQPNLNPKKEGKPLIPLPSPELLQSYSRVTLPQVKQSKVKESKVNNITPSNVETLPEVDTNKNSFPDEPIEEQKPKKAEKISFDFVGEKWTGLKKEHFTNWLEAYPLIDIDRELVKAKEWVLGNLNKSTRKSNWRQFLNNWFSKAQTFEERKVIYAGSYRK
jgi:hypothetical protein